MYPFLVTTTLYWIATISAYKFNKYYATALILKIIYNNRWVDKVKIMRLKVHTNDQLKRYNCPVQGVTSSNPRVTEHGLTSRLTHKMSFLSQQSIALILITKHASTKANTHTHTHTHTHAHTQTHTHIHQSGFYWSKRQWVAVASARPYASLHLAPDR